MHLTSRLRLKIQQRLTHRHALDSKWARDCEALPLLSSHRQLYDIIHLKYWRKFGFPPNLQSPEDFNDKVQWLKLFDQSPDMTRCADKVEARDYAEMRLDGLKGARLTKCYAVLDSPRLLDFNNLPNSFVIKANHDSGSAILVRDKRNYNLAEIKKRLKRAIAVDWGYFGGEWAYLGIQKRILVEELIDTADGRPPADWRFHCINGSIKWIQYTYDHKIDTKEIILDPDGVRLDVQMSPHFKRGEAYCLPEEWETLKLAAERLSRGWKYVRVDLYCEAGEVFFGEMTFYPKAGLYRGCGQKVLGKFMEFDRSTFKHPVFCDRGAFKGF
jgi:hypothetical protein